eukprot:comp24263_c11_seq1/m.45118 comp24263_c11_seq1/g.45118  ORF comp24263_c11_seq1/g.45118 comp24263_c11_seq1/m.45118 type:complete len:349 (+) comp24263_c11_seq1:202-1248(+)
MRSGPGPLCLLVHEHLLVECLVCYLLVRHVAHAQPLQPQPTLKPLPFARVVQVPVGDHVVWAEVFSHPLCGLLAAHGLGTVPPAAAEVVGPGQIVEEGDVCREAVAALKIVGVELAAARLGYKEVRIVLPQVLDVHRVVVPCHGLHEDRQEDLGPLCRCAATQACVHVAVVPGHHTHLRLLAGHPPPCHGIQQVQIPPHRHEHVQILVARNEPTVTVRPQQAAGLERVDEPHVVQCGNDLNRQVGHIPGPHGNGWDRGRLWPPLAGGDVVGPAKSRWRHLHGGVVCQCLEEHICGACHIAHQQPHGHKDQDQPARAAAEVCGLLDAPPLALESCTKSFLSTREPHKHM